MKVKAVIRPEKFICPVGRVKAEGRAAETPFCYRMVVTEKPRKPKKTVVEFHSRITGRKIGYIGEKIGRPLVRSKSQARSWIDATKKTQGTSPEAVEEKIQRFIKTAQTPTDPTTAYYRKLTDQAWAEILREAKKR